MSDDLLEKRHLDCATGSESWTSAGLQVFPEVGPRYELVMCPDGLKGSQAGLLDRSRILPGGRRSLRSVL